MSKIAHDCVCPRCRGSAECGTGLIKGETPSEGDYCMCLYCEAILRYYEAIPESPNRKAVLRLRELTPEEWQGMPEHLLAMFIEVQDLIRKGKRRLGPPRGGRANQTGGKD